MSNNQLTPLIGKSGMLVFINRYGYLNEIHGKLQRADDEKFEFHINGGTTIKVRAEMVKDFVIVDKLITINNDK
jgi:hypothetical protein